MDFQKLQIDGMFGSYSGSGGIANFSTIKEDIIERAYAGICTKSDAMSLLCANPFELFTLANALRSEAVGDVVTYIINRNINFTDSCTGTCRFCAFKDDNGGSFRLSSDEMLKLIQEAHDLGAVEVCIQGGLVRDFKVHDLCEILESVRSNFPDIHIHAFSPMEVLHAAGNSGMSVEDALVKLKSAGLGSMPGTAAEILSDRVRKEICPDKLSSAQWRQVITAAHRLGIRTTATMMYGHIETMEERVDHILTIRDIQMETGGFTEFVPLAFMPFNSPLGRQVRFASPGMSDLQMYALSRILLHRHIKNIQTSWVKLGRKMAQVALFCGANDMGGTLMNENISKSAGASHGEYMAPEEFDAIITSAGKIPKQRMTVY